MHATLHSWISHLYYFSSVHFESLTARMHVRCTHNTNKKRALAQFVKSKLKQYFGLSRKYCIRSHEKFVVSVSNSLHWFLTKRGSLKWKNCIDSICRTYFDTQIKFSSTIEMENLINSITSAIFFNLFPELQARERFISILQFATNLTTVSFIAIAL